MHPGIIERPVEADEIKIYFDVREPVPLPVFAQFLLEIDRAAREAMDDDFVLELTDLVSGSKEARFRAKRKRQRNKPTKPGLPEQHLRIAQAGVALTAITAAMQLGALAKPTDSIVNNFNGSFVMLDIGSPSQPEYFKGEELAQFADRYERGQAEVRAMPRHEEQKRLLDAFHDGDYLELVGRRMSTKPKVFRTVRGTKLPILGYPDHMPVGGLTGIVAEVQIGADESDIGIIIHEYKAYQNE